MSVGLFRSWIANKITYLHLLFIAVIRSTVRYVLLFFCRTKPLMIYCDKNPANKTLFLKLATDSTSELDDSGLVKMLCRFSRISYVLS